MTHRAAVFSFAALMLALPAQAQDLSIATGGTGGVYFPLGGGMAEIINTHIEGVRASAEVTGASVENVALIARGDSDIAISSADVVYQAFNGLGDFEGRQVEDLRVLAALYPTAIQIVTLADSGISSIEDLRGQRVSVGAPGSGTEVGTRMLLEANGITFDDINAQRLNFNETADALRDGDIAAGFWSVGLPTSSIMNLATTRNIAMVPLTEEQVAAALAADPTFAPFTLPAGLYEGMEEDVQAIANPNLLIASAEMDEDLVYSIISTLFEQQQALIAVHPVANDMSIGFSIDATPIPFHAGAARFFEEQGAELKDHQRP